MTIEYPSEFICPITNDVMRDPLMTKYGKNFERDAILRWISDHSNTCPTTRQPLRPSDLVPNRALQLRIKNWCSVNVIDIDTPGLMLDGSRNPDQVFLTLKIKEVYEVQKPCFSEQRSRRHDRPRWLPRIGA
jgi:hypothetical protein